MTQPQSKTLILWLLHSCFSIFVVVSSLWLCMALWVQQPFGVFFSRVLIGVWLAFALSVLGIYATHLFSRKKDVLLYIIGFLMALGWYLSLQPQQNRDWNPEVARLLSYEQQGNIVTLHNVRNFDWQADGNYIEHWETRRFDLSQISGVNIITSYWMGPQIAHTLVSFDFDNAAPITFSIEIRKEKTEDFSAIGGFFRQFELSLVASDEKDIVYTRSNIRNEQVYFFPVKMAAAERRALFEEYLTKADQLAQHPKWYNTLTSNCTTLVFDMVQAVSKQALPADYRLIASGYLPNYLHDLNVIQPDIDMATWYQIAHVNPKSHGQNLTSAQYSALLRQGVVRP
jgi:hypothetical protein